MCSSIKTHQSAITTYNGHQISK